MTAFKSPFPPVRLVIERDGVETSVGEGGDLAWSDVRNLGRQHKRRPLPAELVGCVVRVLKHFEGARVE